MTSYSSHLQAEPTGNGAGLPDLEAELAGHRTWQRRLRAVIQGESQEQLEEQEVSGQTCALGRWLDGAGAAYRFLPEFEELALRHEHLHREAARVLAHVRADERLQAQRVLITGLARASADLSATLQRFIELHADGAVATPENGSRSA